jgi:hypothetical protein
MPPGLRRPNPLGATCFGGEAKGRLQARTCDKAGLTMGLVFFPELHYMRRSFAP